jgi:hypothetical protein
MIVQATGLPGLSVLETTAMLNKLGVTYGVVVNGRLQRVEGRMENQSLYPVVFHTASMFMRTYNRFKTKRVVALVIDNPYAIQYELGLSMAGATFTKNSILFSQFTEKDMKALLIEAKEMTEPLTFVRMPYSITTEVLKLYGASSLSALQTFLYKIKDVESREFVSKTVKMWMRTDATFAVLEPKLKKYIPLKSIEGLKAIVNTKAMRTFREAVRKVAAKPELLQKIAKDYKLAAFDIKYLLSTTS